MKSDLLRLRSLWRLFGACLLSAPMLAACAKPTPPVSVHGVNYSGDAFSYVVIDPNNAKNTAQGELIGPYAAGGTTCCYELPKKWQYGIKISVQSTHWLGKAADRSLHEIVATHLVEVPRYPDGNPGELWVLRATDGSMSVVSSDFQPDHPDWPGIVKGWPVPSLAYRRERWDIDIDHQKFFLHAYEEFAAMVKSAPDEAAQEEWDNSLQYDKKSLSGFSGPQDLAYRKKIEQTNKDGLERVRARLEQLRKGRP
jgi:hypothetical protein